MQKTPMLWFDTVPFHRFDESLSWWAVLGYSLVRRTNVEAYMVKDETDRVLVCGGGEGERYNLKCCHVAVLEFPADEIEYAKEELYRKGYSIICDGILRELDEYHFIRSDGEGYVIIFMQKRR